MADEKIRGRAAKNAITRNITTISNALSTTKAVFRQTAQRCQEEGLLSSTEMDQLFDMIAKPLADRVDDFVGIIQRLVGTLPDQLDVFLCILHEADTKLIQSAAEDIARTMRTYGYPLPKYHQAVQTTCTFYMDITDTAAGISQPKPVKEDSSVLQNFAIELSQVLISPVQLSQLLYSKRCIDEAVLNQMETINESRSLDGKKDTLLTAIQEAVSGDYRKLQEIAIVLLEFKETKSLAIKILYIYDQQYLHESLSPVAGSQLTAAMMSNEERASDILRCHYWSLSQHLKRPIAIAKFLSEAKVISEAESRAIYCMEHTESRKVTMLLKALRYAVRKDHTALRVFAKQLQKFPQQYAIADAIMSDYEEVFVEKTTQQEVDDDDDLEVKGSPSSPANSSDCPSEQPVLIPRSMKPDFNSMKMEFGTMFSSFRQAVKKSKISVDDLKDFLEDCYPELLPDIVRSNNLSDVLRLVRSKCTIIDIRCLRGILANFQITEADTAIQSYSEKLNEFCSSVSVTLSLEKVFSFNVSPLVSYNTATFVLDWDPDNCTIDDIKDILSISLKELATNVSIDVIQKGNSIIVTCSFPDSLTGLLIARAFETLELTKREKLFRLTIGSCIVYDIRNEQDKSIHVYEAVSTEQAVWRATTAQSQKYEEIAEGNNEAVGNETRPEEITEKLDSDSYVTFHPVPKDSTSTSTKGTDSQTQLIKEGMTPDLQLKISSLQEKPKDLDMNYSYSYVALHPVVPKVSDSQVQLIEAESMIQLQEKPKVIHVVSDEEAVPQPQLTKESRSPTIQTETLLEKPEVTIKMHVYEEKDAPATTDMMPEAPPAIPQRNASLKSFNKPPELSQDEIDEDKPPLPPKHSQKKMSDPISQVHSLPQKEPISKLGDLDEDDEGYMIIKPVSVKGQLESEQPKAKSFSPLHSEYLSQGDVIYPCDMVSLFSPTPSQCKITMDKLIKNKNCFHLTITSAVTNSSPVDIIKLVIQRLHQTGVRELRLVNTPLSSDFGILGFSILTSLNLKNSPFVDSNGMARMVRSFFTNTSLRNLQISSDWSVKKDVYIFTQLLINSRTLQELSLIDCDIDDKGVGNILYPLHHINTTLTSLSIAANPRITSISGRLIAQMLMSNSSLTSLDIHDTSLTDNAVVCSILEALLANKTGAMKKLTFDEKHKKTCEQHKGYSDIESRLHFV